MTGAGITARVDGWIIKHRVDIEANLPDLGADRNGSRGKDGLWQQCNLVRHAKESRSIMWQNHGNRRIDLGGTPQEQNPVEVRRQNLEQDTEAETHTSESLTMWLRQMQQRRGEGQRTALSCLTQKNSERKTPCEPRRGWRRSRRMQ